MGPDVLKQERLREAVNTLLIDPSSIGSHVSPD